MRPSLAGANGFGSSRSGLRCGKAERALVLEHLVVPRERCFAKRHRRKQRRELLVKCRRFYVADARALTRARALRRANARCLSAAKRYSRACTALLARSNAAICWRSSLLRLARRRIQEPLGVLGTLTLKKEPSPSIADAMDVHLRPCAHRDTLMSEVNRQQTKINYSPVFFFLNIIFKNWARGGRPTVGRLAANQWTRGWKFQLRDRQRRFYACRACRPPWERAVTRLLRRLGCSAALRGCPAGEPKAI